MPYLELKIEESSGKFYVRLSGRTAYIPSQNITLVNSPRRIEGPPSQLEARLSSIKPVHTIDGRALSPNAFYILAKGVGPGNRANIVLLCHIPEDVLRRYNKT